jgi:hypothetical protein
MSLETVQEFEHLIKHPVSDIFKKAHLVLNDYPAGTVGEWKFYPI